MIVALVVAGVVVGLASMVTAASDDRDRHARAEVEALNAELLSHPSATETLTRWCAVHHLAADPKIVAVRDGTVDKAPDAVTLELLGGLPAASLKYRRVELRCGSRTLSEADNWYRPDRLTPEMNSALETSRTPFGIVVRPLAFTRRTLEVIGPTSPNAAAIRPFVLRHRAVLSTGGGAPFSVVEENYTADVTADTRF